MSTELIACLVSLTNMQVESSIQRNLFNNKMYLYPLDVNAYSKNVRFKRIFF